MGCTSSTTTVDAVDFSRAAPFGAKPGPERDFHREYALKEKLGQGTYAVVYAATRKGRGDERLAVKVVDIRDALSKHLNFDDMRMRVDRPRFKSVKLEAEMLHAVRGHDNVCRMSEYFIHGGLAYIVLAKYDRTLPEAWAASETMNEETLRPFLRGMLNGVAAVHARRIVHRDVKPDNFMCSGPENTVKLCDFGLACAVAALGSRENADSSGVFGTAPYIAPEMLEQKEYGTKVDVWSFGVVVHVLVCGCFPYTSHEKTSSSMKAAILKGTSTSKLLNATGPHRALEGMSEEAASFIIALLSRSAKKRPACQAALRDAFFTSCSLSQVCLRRKFEVAKICGAFTQVTTRKAGIGDVDFRLRQLQDRRGEVAVTRKRTPSSDVSTDAGSRLNESGHSSDSAASAEIDRPRVVVCTTAYGQRRSRTIAF